ncbi:methylated-DNA--[protein]-cysteine S-methyltransferase [Sphingomonas oligoaromativorans]|uniref:methylated-DNA--[protein]-cysteine S-methyltransferase n=1 Tax=Sphingomonas oligoaromativorans TaxID=575322 RepID=UPI001422A2A3|nr:methylated-DNA--[protein]-cysteine S-methyltransferase [Sphingomonas oligoaromativorans]
MLGVGALRYKPMPSPVGTLRLVGSDEGLVAILWENDRPRRVPVAAMAQEGDNALLREVQHQLASYFEGTLQKFDLPLDFRGTDFQRQVWSALLDIPFGQTRSYADIARAIGRPIAYRAVGAANGRNPISIVAPCHRVIGHNGGLTGFAGGIEAKRYLLELERRPPPVVDDSPTLR